MRLMPENIARGRRRHRARRRGSDARPLARQLLLDARSRTEEKRSMFSINDTKSERFTMPTRAQSLAVARRATLCALAAVGVAACGADAPEPEGSSDPTALS